MPTTTDPWTSAIIYKALHLPLLAECASILHPKTALCSTCDVRRTSCRVPRSYRHWQFELPSLPISRLLMPSPAEGSHRLTLARRVLAGLFTSNTSATTNPTMWLPAAAPTPARIAIPPLQQSLPYTSSALMGFFPSYYRRHLLHHNTAARHGIGLVKQLSSPQPVTSHLLGGHGPIAPLHPLLT